MLVGDNLDLDNGGDGGSDTFKGREGADMVLGTCGVVSSLLRRRFEGRYCIHLGNCLLVFLAFSVCPGVVGGRRRTVVDVGIGATASTSRRQNLQRGGLVSAIPLESPVQAGGVSGAFPQI